MASVLLSPRISGRLGRWGVIALVSCLLIADVNAQGTLSDKNMSIVWQAVRNTRLHNNFHLSATLTTPRVEGYAEADVAGADFQLNTRTEILRFVRGVYYSTRDAGQTWAKIKPQTALITAILSPIASPFADLPSFDYLGTSSADGVMLYHYRLHVAPDDSTPKDKLPQFWIYQTTKQRWYVHQARCPVMMPDETIPMVNIVVTRIDEIKPIEVPKVTEAP